MYSARSKSMSTLASPRVNSFSVIVFERSQSSCCIRRAVPIRRFLICRRSHTSSSCRSRTLPASATAAPTVASDGARSGHGAVTGQMEDLRAMMVLRVPCSANGDDAPPEPSEVRIVHNGGGQRVD